MALGQACRLKELHLDEMSLSPLSFSNLLSRLCSLHTLSLQNTHGISPECFSSVLVETQALYALGISELSLDASLVSKASLTAIGGLPGLQRLRVYGVTFEECEITSESLRSLELQGELANALVHP